MATVPANSNGHTKTIYEDTETSLPPNNIDAEDALISSVLIDPERFSELDLEPIMFFSGFNREIYTAFKMLREQKRPIDLVTVMDVLRGNGIEEDSKLIGLLNVAPTSSNMMGYAGIVKRMYNKRRLIQISGTMANAAFNTEEPVDEIIAKTLEEIRVVGGNSDNGSPVSSYDICDNTLVNITDRRENKDARSLGSVTTGFVDLDRMLEGLDPGALVIFAGRPGQGKSIMEQSVRLNVAKQGKRVAAFNLEMGADQLMIRAISAKIKIPYKRIYNSPHTLSKQEWQNFNTALGQLSQLPMWIDDTPSLTISQLESKVHRMFAEYGHFDLVTVDYLQLMRGRKDARNRVEEVGQISRGMKQLARELNTVVWANAQVNRAVESRNIRMPMLSDLRESGDIEQDADVVGFILREEVYNPETELKNTAKVDIAKNRNGSTGELMLYFNAAHMRIANYQRTNANAAMGKRRPINL